MSSGPFINSKYEAGGGRIYRCRIQPESAGLVIGAITNGPPAGDVNQAVSARSSSSRRSFGVTMRAVTVEWTGTPPGDYTGEPLRVPILQPDFFDSIVPGALGLYLDIACRVVSKIPEQER